MNWQTVIEAATRMAAQATTKGPRLASDDSVAAAIERMARNGYRPSPCIIDPLRHILVGRGVLLRGNTGVGKTFLFQSLGYRIQPADEIAEIRLADIREWLDGRKEKRMVIDDLGCERKVVEYGATEEVMRLVIAHRADRAKAVTHVTTNLSAEDIGARYGDRTLSRLLGMCAPFTLAGPDMRTQERGR